VLDKYEEEIEEEDLEPQLVPPVFLEQLSPDTQSTLSSDSSIGPGYHILAHVRHRPEDKRQGKKQKKTIKKQTKPRSNIVVIPPPNSNQQKPMLRQMIDKHRASIVPQDPSTLRNRVHGLLDTMRETEDEIARDDEDRELDQLEGEVMEDDEEEFDEEEDDEEEEDEEATEIRLQHEENQIEEELKELEREVERDRKIERAGSGKQVHFIDMPYFANEFQMLERELSLTDRKKRILELFFYKVRWHITML
jgi:TATA-binding protein-associated factor Taf7